MVLLLQQLLPLRPKPIDDPIDLRCAVGRAYDRLAPLQHGSVAGALSQRLWPLTRPWAV